jgi:hypothetical protein
MPVPPTNLELFALRFINSFFYYQLVLNYEIIDDYSIGFSMESYGIRFVARISDPDTDIVDFVETCDSTVKFSGTYSTDDCGNITKDLMDEITRTGVLLL